MMGSVERKLRDRIEELEEIICQMKEATQVIEFDEHLPLEWNLRPSSERILLALYHAIDGQLPARKLIQAARIDLQSYDPGNILRSNICNLRKRMKLYGIEIRTRYGIGYQLSPGSRIVIRDTLEQGVVQ